MSNRKESKEIYAIRAEETIRQGECTYCVHVGSLLPIPIIHACEILVHITSFRIPLNHFPGLLWISPLRAMGFEDVENIQQHTPTEG